MPTLSQIYPTYLDAVRVLNDLEAAGVPARDITLVSGEKGAGARTGAGKAGTDTRAYAESISRGGTLVSVRADDAQVSRIEAILHAGTAEQDETAETTAREDLVVEEAADKAVAQNGGRAATQADQLPDAVPAGAFQDRVIEVRATGEEPVVSKEARVVEEIVVRKEATDRLEIVRDTVRETKVDVEDSTTRR